MKKRQMAHKRAESLSFRPTFEMREEIVALADKHTRSMADQVEHLAKIGLMVTKTLKTDDPDTIMERVALKSSQVIINGHH
jgi:hypothetical protein